MRSRFLRIVLFLFVFGLFPSASFADGLFNNPATRQAVALENATAAFVATRRSRAVEIDAEYLESRIAPIGVDQLANRLSLVPAQSSVRIELFPGVTVDLERVSIQQAFGGGFIWSGEASGTIPAQAILVIRDGHVTGQVTVMGRTQTEYRIDPLGTNGFHRITEMDPRGYPDDHPDDYTEDHSLLHGHAGHDHDHGGHDDGPDGHDQFGRGHDDEDARPFIELEEKLDTAENVGPTVTIDMLIAYTSAATSGVDIVSQANLAIASANTSFGNSGVGIEFRLVGVELVEGYVESDFSTMLGHLRSGTQTGMQNIRAQRDALGADLVSLFVARNDFCGIAYLGSGPDGNFDDSLGFGVVHVGCITNRSFEHEAGHNMALRHDRYVSGSPPNSEYYYGHVITSERVRSVMAYNNRCSANGYNCSRLQYFSNPDLDYNGQPWGIEQNLPGAADNARWLNEHRASIADYRPTSGGGGGNAPANNLFADRILIDGPDRVQGSNVGATAEPGQPALATMGSNAVWWRFVADRTGDVVVDTCGSLFDTTLTVFTGSTLASLSRVAANDDDPDDICGVDSRVTFSATQGVEYQIAVAGFNNAEGDIDLGVTYMTVITGPSNDNFADRTRFRRPGRYLGSNVDATAEAGQPTLAGGASNAVWWNFRPRRNGRVAIDTCLSNFDTTLTVFRGIRLNQLNVVAMNDDSCGTQSRVVMRVRAGRQYPIAVAGFGGAEGDINLRIRFLR